MTRPCVQEFDAARHLDNPEVIVAYIKEVFETGDPVFIKHAIRTLARAAGILKAEGMTP